MASAVRTEQPMTEFDRLLRWYCADRLDERLRQACGHWILLTALGLDPTQGKHHGRAAVMEGRAENHTPGKAALRRIQPQRGEQDPVARGLPQALIQTIRAIPTQQTIEFGHGRLGSNS